MTTLSTILGRTVNASVKQSAIAPRSAWLSRFGVASLVYVLATGITAPSYPGDTIDVVTDVLAARPGPSGGFWDFGHVLWRPIAWAGGEALRPLAPFMPQMDAFARVSLALLAINWLAGLLSVLLMADLIAHLCPRRWAVHLGTIAFALSQGFLNYAQTGDSYVAGLALVLLGLDLLLHDALRQRHSPGMALAAGASLAGAVCLWFLYVLAIPAALAMPLLLFPDTRRQWKLVMKTATAMAVVCAIVYGSVLVHLRIFTPAALHEWMAASSHGVTHIGGVSRMVFGFPRSFIDMGNDGVLFKRFLVHDPYAPVSLMDLLRLSLWKLVLFYILLGATCLALWRTPPGRRTLSLLAVSAIPVLGFAAVWQGADRERYFGLYPFLFIAMGVGLSAGRASRWVTPMSLAFAIALVVSNASAMATGLLNQSRDAATARIHDLLPLLRPASRVFTVQLQDELVSLSRGAPLKPLSSRPQVNATRLLLLGTSQVAQWKSEFASEALSAWQHGGDVWVSRRALHARPKREWNWVEGADDRISWNDIHAFFAQLETGRAVGGEDGFVQVLPSEHNQRLLASVQ